MAKTNKMKKFYRGRLSNSKRLCDIYNLKLEMTKLYEEFEAECEAISEECEADGYPSHGSTYELRAENAWKYYESWIDCLANKINQLGGIF